MFANISDAFSPREFSGAPKNTTLGNDCSTPVSPPTSVLPPQSPGAVEKQETLLIHSLWSHFKCKATFIDFRFFSYKNNTDMGENLKNPE